MEYPFLILLHVVFGILWAGGATVLGLFVLPAVVDAGPAGGAVMAGVVKRRMPVVLTMAAALVVLTGLRLYMLRFSSVWLTSPEGIVLSLGALLGLGAFVLARLRPEAHRRETCPARRRDRQGWRTPERVAGRGAPRPAGEAPADRQVDGVAPDRRLAAHGQPSAGVDALTPCQIPRASARSSPIPGSPRNTDRS